MINYNFQSKGLIEASKWESNDVRLFILSWIGKKERVNEFLQRGCPQGSPRYFRGWSRSRWRRGEKNEWNPLEGRFRASDLCRSALTFTTLHIHTRACHTNPPSVFEARQSRNPSLSQAWCSSRCVTCIVNALFSLCRRCRRATCVLISGMFVYRNVNLYNWHNNVILVEHRF